jgi:hypothetical protein
MVLQQQYAIIFKEIQHLDQKIILDGNLLL